MDAADPSPEAVLDALLDPVWMIRRKDEDEEFLALLEISAMASIFTVVLRNHLEARRVIKLRYDETCSGRRGTDTFLIHSSWRRGGEKVRERESFS